MQVPLYFLRKIGGKVNTVIGYYSKPEAKQARDALNKELGSVKYCVTRTPANLKSSKPNSRSGGK